MLNSQRPYTFIRRSENFHSGEEKYSKVTQAFSILLTSFGEQEGGLVLADSQEDIMICLP